MESIKVCKLGFHTITLNYGILKNWPVSKLYKVIIGFTGVDIM